MRRRRRALAIGLFALAAATALAAPEDAISGRRIFYRGGAAGEVIATFPGSGALLPPRLRRCAGCHGPDGRGAREGGIEIPAITWTALAAPRDASPAQPGRPGYDEATLARALSDGVDSTGRRLAAGMPRFALTEGQRTALLDYLRVVGTGRDLDPGISTDEIRVGAVLPLSGPQAARGAAMRAGLEDALAAAGPIYGRTLRLVAVDAGEDAALAVRRLAASDRIFALVATVLPAGVEEAEESEEMPVIGPLLPSAAQPAANHFHLLAPLDDQMRVLVDELASEIPHPLRLAVIGAKGRVADAVADQAAHHGAIIVRCRNIEELTALETAPDAVVALPDVDLGPLVAQRGGWLLAGPVETIAPGNVIDERLRLVLPVLPAAVRGDAPPLAIAAVAVIVEGLKRMGARPSRAGLVAAIETLRDFPTGVLPPLSFSRSQHLGTHAAVVIRPDRGDGITVLGGWRTPR